MSGTRPSGARPSGVRLVGPRAAGGAAGGAASGQAAAARPRWMASFTTWLTDLPWRAATAAARSCASALSPTCAPQLPVVPRGNPEELVRSMHPPRVQTYKALLNILVSESDPESTAANRRCGSAAC